MSVNMGAESAYFGQEIPLPEAIRPSQDELNWKIINAAREGNEPLVKELLQTGAIALEYLDSAVKAADKSDHKIIAGLIRHEISENPLLTTSESPGKGRQAIIKTPKKMQEAVKPGYFEKFNTRQITSTRITGFAVAIIGAYVISFFI